MSTQPKQVHRRLLAVLGSLAFSVTPLSALAHGYHGRGGNYYPHYRHGVTVNNYYGHYYRHHGYCCRRGYWSGGRWIAGAVIAGTAAGLVSAAVSAPREQEVVYAAPPPVEYEAMPATTVIYEGAPIPTRQTVTTITTTTY